MSEGLFVSGCLLFFSTKCKNHLCVDDINSDINSVLCNWYCLNGSRSTTGTPQGHVLGPLLFSLHKNYWSFIVNWATINNLADVSAAYWYTSVPVFIVWLQVSDQVTRSGLHRDGLIIQSDDVGGDLGAIAVWLLPLQEEAGRPGLTWVWGDWEVEESEGGDRVGNRGRGPETDLLAVGTSAGLIYSLRGRQKRNKTAESYYGDKGKSKRGRADKKTYAYKWNGKKKLAGARLLQRARKQKYTNGKGNKIH